MIVPMMKLSLLIFYKEYQTFLGELREKGMVHIHENTERTAEDTDLQAKLMLIRRTGEMITRMQSRNDVEQVEKVKVDDEHLLDYLEGLDYTNLPDNPANAHRPLSLFPPAPRHSDSAYA